MANDNQSSLGRTSRSLLKNEGKVSNRKLQVGKKKAVEVVTFFLQEEATIDTAINNYTDLFDLTQEEGFLLYQKVAHERKKKGEPLALEMLVQGLIQLKGLDDLIVTICGYLWSTRTVIAHASENVKQAAHDALARYDGEITGLTGMDKEKCRWRIQFNPAHPESVTLKRVRSDQGQGRKDLKEESPSTKSTKD